MRILVRCILTLAAVFGSTAEVAGADIVIPGRYSMAKLPTDLAGIATWLAIEATGGQWALTKARLRAEQEDTYAQRDRPVVKLSTTSPNAVALVSSFAIKPGPIVPATTAEGRPFTAMTFRAVPAPGDVASVDLALGDKTYRLALTRTGGGTPTIILQQGSRRQILSMAGFTQSAFEILFAGDIDLDGNLDLVVSDHFRYQGLITQALMLSSFSTTDSLLGLGAIRELPPI